MVQRIQSVYLLCVAVVTGLMFFAPVATISVPGEACYEFFTTKVVQYKGEMMAWNWVSLALNALVVLLAVVTMFVRKPGKSVKPTLLLQLRLCFVEVVLLLGLVVLSWLEVRGAAAGIGEMMAEAGREVSVEWKASLPMVFPVVGLVFMWLAIRGVVKDLALLKSYDRIR